ncbi:bifunctional UDP-N-acetylmuramoyl-L-alanyl-D-glutamate--2,6-diaminopimelate ligase MurE/UDP-N-acetylmuramoyl-tripeptide--D-alanyl-D-alanine ligase MurF [Aquabacterium sp. A7-Y]|uniref:bifunctional UDP-N-acetylmuramoyl-L-alanyl-D-glutamate--2, 6-diaminopimelate ligase MurE/UDP-N-acetylmuramoyl-tripeptide--D-alanyl-D-alanine ligase MurF n=1 Tax=Aquabacterium sp. A7-Y TaxID=1349605 RepID=UPI00223CD7E7|nr:bifunctional UDP-N-acetylmuramoyl-L-alanyl-D-glutamate--2,6-diaminopimelate ligase MurE/UDP-N-acetylmuramoyl-tripeptide--D-alanyl-D-alanine ligase MurF [Aquabacterium sp. A7-Y]MCW7537368.1 bifunctional UDP-N-acetylmuramoyl-L-alanyl-D-glutamate--2,6-diaminopimelate ligase MurE/UDP-N-acetylmuramoyl-tripeptide--D-alanyl-D-alanine ligase MurF [Aquabacterium sp. A7-Y]
MALDVLTSPEAAADWLRARVTGALCTDSRRVAPGDAFVAWPGYARDGRAFVAAALQAGAAACLVEAEGAEAYGFDAPGLAGRVAAVAGLKAASGAIADAWYGQPSRQLRVVAATGTNGKTSSAWWVAQALSLMGRRCGVIGTLGVGEPPSRAVPDARIVSTGLTTPDPVTLHAALRGWLDQGLKACAIEASSIGIVEHRLDGLRIEVALFTNFTRDHLDYHGDMTSYWAAKERLFGWPGLRAAVINLDDPQGAALAMQLRAEGRLQVIGYSLVDGGELLAREVSYQDGGLCFTLVEGAHTAPVRTSLIGDYNVANLLGVIGALRALGIGLAEAAAVCAELTPVAGRMQRVGGASGPLAVIDYAHTPDALEKALQALRPLAEERGGRLWCVFGCGGDRDSTKRPLMGAIAERLADRVVVTSDNPRTEPPEAILAQIVAGMARPAAATVLADRRAAIGHALGQADPADVVLIAGKGHEDYQDIGGRKHHFSDVEEAEAALHRRVPPMMTLALAHSLLKGATLEGDPEVQIERVHSDTRSLRPGDLFVALKGERFDAHDFLAQAKAAGAVAALAERGLAEAGLSGLQVADSKLALGELAAGWRARFGLPLIAVTGSNGKTTVTQMIAAILRAWLGDTAFSTVGNFNNDIGLPLTLLRLRGEHRAGVVELGMNHPGEIAYLSRIAAPTVALVNNAQREHQEFMATVEAVARENGSVIESLDTRGVAVFPADEPYTALWKGLAGTRRVMTFASQGPADVTGEGRWAGDHWALHLRTPAGEAGTELRIAGAHNIKNALAASACALAAGVPLDAVARGLRDFEPVKGRSQVKSYRRAGRQVTLVDDTYNANPDSMRAAVDVVAAMPGPRWLVLGDMGEVGDQGPAFHTEIGDYARAQGIDVLWTAGAQMQYAARAFGGARHFDSAAALAAALHEQPEAGCVLVKGSRFMKMEQVVEALLASPSGAAASDSQDKNASGPSGAQEPRC